jgi:O-antigen/teichoic acid export membrane protein
MSGAPGPADVDRSGPRVTGSPRTARTILDLVVNRFSVPFFTLALLVVIARQSSELLGWYAVVNVYFFALQTLPFLGLTPWIMREAARRPQDAATIFGSSIALAIGASAVLALVLPLVLRVAGYPPFVDQAIWIAAATTVPFCVAYAAELMFVTRHDTAIVSVAPALESVARVAVSLVALQQGYGLAALFWIAFAGRILTAALYWRALRRGAFRHTPIRCSLPLIGTMLRISPVFVVNTAALFVVQRAAFIVMSWSVSPAAIADFTIAYRPMEIGLIAITAFAGALYPQLSAADAMATPDAFRLLSSRMTRLMLAASTVVAAIGISMSGVFVGVLFPRQPDAAPLLSVLMGALVFNAIRVVTSSVFLAAGRVVADSVTLGAGAVLQCVLLLWLVPVYGPWGAAAAILIESVVQSVGRAVVQSGALQHPRRVATLGALSLAVLAAATAGAAVTSPLTAAGLGTVLTAAYAYAAVRVGGVDRTDLAFLRARREVQTEMAPA